MPQKDIPWTLRSMSGDTRLSPFLNTIRRKGILEAAEGRKGEGEWGSSAWHPLNHQCHPNKPEAICKFKSFLEQGSPFQKQFFFFSLQQTKCGLFFFFNQGEKNEIIFYSEAILSTDSYEKAERMYRCQSQLKLGSTNPPSPECPTNSAAPTAQISQHTKGTLQSSFLPVSKILASALKVVFLAFNQDIWLSAQWKWENALISVCKLSQ